MLSAQKQRFSSVSEIPKKYNWARAQHKHSPSFLFGSWCSHWHSFGPQQPSLSQIMNAQAQGAAHITDCSHTLGMTKCWEKIQTPTCEPAWATQPQHLRPIPGLGWFSRAVLTNEGLGFQVLLLQHTHTQIHKFCVGKTTDWLNSYFTYQILTMRNCGESGLKNCLGVYCTYNASLSSATEIKCCLCKLMPDFQILITHSWLIWTSHWLPPGSELSFILFNILQTQMRFFY